MPMKKKKEKKEKKNDVPEEKDLITGQAEEEKMSRMERM